MLPRWELSVKYRNSAAFMEGVNKVLEEPDSPIMPITMGYGTPLDLIGDGLRDVTNVLLDIYRYPDKIKKKSMWRIDGINYESELLVT